MKLTEYLDAINVNLRILYYPNQGRRFCCYIENGEIKDGIGLISEHGNGESPREAAEDYFKSIAGKKLVLHAFSNEYRREFTVPLELEIDI